LLLSSGIALRTSGQQFAAGRRSVAEVSEALGKPVTDIAQFRDVPL
jgi:hypothetical protein